MSYETILVEQKGAVTLITLNRPKALNALSSVVLGELIEAFAAYEADASQRCAVVTGSGDKAFAAGADIKEMVEKSGAQFFAEDFFAGWTSQLVKAVRKPWIAAVNGFALGGVVVGTGAGHQPATSSSRARRTISRAAPSFSTTK